MVVRHWPPGSEPSRTWGVPGSDAATGQPSAPGNRPIHSIMKIMRIRTKPPTLDEARSHLPLRPVAFALLAALADGGRPGIEILDEVNSTLPGRPIFGPGTLYRLMRELRQGGFISARRRWRTSGPRITC